MQDFVRAFAQKMQMQMQRNTLARPITPSALEFFSFTLSFSLLLLVQPEPRLRLYSRLVPSPQGGPAIITIQLASMHIHVVQ